LAGRAFILETPIDKPGDDRRNVRTLWELVGVNVKQAPKAVDGFSMTRAPAKTVKQRTRKTLTRKAVPKPKKVKVVKKTKTN
jgi:hypothetical protein